MFCSRVHFADPLKALLIAWVRFEAARSRSVVEGLVGRGHRALQFSLKRAVKSLWSSVSTRNRLVRPGKRAFQFIFIRSGMWSEVQSRYCARVVLAVRGPVMKARSSTLPFEWVLMPFSDASAK